jgi:TRAP-type mannitol/chloroaromatic compound transport system permease small subunit
MLALRRFISSVDHFTERCGRALAWLTLVLATTVFLVVVIRYGLGLGSVAMQESTTYLHALVFMLGAAYTLRSDGHVRVDIFYRRFNRRGKAWVNAVGTILFLLPFCVFVIGISVPFVAEAWRILEGSQDPGGIHAVFLLKTLIPLMAASLLLQGLAELARNALVLVGEE